MAGAVAEDVPIEELKARYRRPATLPFPKGNPYSEAKAELGKLLFFDPRLSGSGMLSCASCHNPALGWTDGLPRGMGHGMRELRRRTPTVMDMAFGAAFMWDGRAVSLEQQALLPITSPDEMNMPVERLEATVRAIDGYRPYFAAAFPEGGIDAETIALALATYERTLVSGPAPFDRWIEGDETAIPEAAKRGFALFNTKARCAKCHAGWRLTDDSFHDIGLPGPDLGRGEHVPASVTIMQRAFKTPTLRNVTRGGPYMHDGSMADLDAVLDHYEDDDLVRRPSLSPEMRPVDLLAEEREALVAFLETLESAPQEVTLPVLPR
jgi:cytochrome c peroxidase